METCVGCGSPIAPAWKYCVHCGIAIERPEEIPAAIRPDPIAPLVAKRLGRAYIIGGVGVFLVGIALLVVAIAFFNGAFN
jgi:hypothetical protein